MSRYDLVIKGGDLVMPGLGVVQADLAVSDEKIAAIALDIPASEAEKTIDATGKAVFPGAIDSHFHIGIYRPLSEDAQSESGSAASGGVTSILSYFRTGHNYLNKTGAFKEIFPELLDKSAGHFLTDYGYHVAIMSSEQLNEIEWLVRECGVTTFKYYMFYKSLDLSGSKKSDGYLMLQDSLDFGFLYRFMKEVARMNRLMADRGGVRLSIHCENPEIITAAMAESQANPTGNVLKDYSNARPGWQEALAIKEVGVLAHQTGCPVNLLHLSGSDAVLAALQVADEYPEVNFLLEGTLHHLSMSNDNDYGPLGKVNPPVRNSEEVDFLWDSVMEGFIDTVVSDHACHPKELRQGDLWSIMPGFGGTGLMFPVLINEGYHKRGLSLERIAELSSYNPAVYHNLYPQKGSLMVGSDADITVVDLNREKEVTVKTLCSAQDYTPFEGMKLKGWPDCTILRGKTTFEQDRVCGRPGWGKYLFRPLGK